MGRVARQALRGHSREMMPRYAELYGHYRDDASFLYNYAAEQFYAGRYEEALSTARECRALWPSYNLSLLTGDICRAAGKYGKPCGTMNRLIGCVPSGLRLWKDCITHTSPENSRIGQILWQTW